jgi:shikimate kinase
MPPKRNIYFVGPMGSGKTAVGRRLARELGMQFFDADQEIERRTGVDIPFIFDKEGEGGFRSREKAAIEELTQLEGIVLATGGGAVLDADNRARLSATGTVVFLDTTIDEQLERTRPSRNRPLLLDGDPRSVLEALRETRQPLYEEIADLRFDTTGKRVATIAKNVRKLLMEKDLLPLQK